MMKLGGWRGIGFGLVFLFSAATAQAGFSSVFGVGPESMGMGGTSLRGVDADGHAAFQQPARLGYLNSSKLSLSVVNTEVKLKPFGRVVVNEAGTTGIFDSAGVLGGRGQMLGLAIPLGPKKRPFGIGVSAYLSGDSVSRVSGPPINNPYYPLYQDVTRNAAYTVAVGYRVWQGLSLGFGANTSLLSLADYRLVNAQNGTSYSASTVEVKSAFSPSFAAVYDFRCADECGGEDKGPPLVVGLIRRGKSELKTKLTAAVSIQSVPVTGELVSFPHFSPAEWGLMGSYAINELWLLSLDLSYVQWSEYRNPYGSGNVNSFIFGSSSISAGFKDVLVSRLGLSRDWNFSGSWLKTLTARFGYFFYPSPVPAQTTNSNYADSDRHGISLGTGLKVSNPLGAEAAPLRLDLFGQYNLLVAKNTSKQLASNLGAPGYPVGGDIWVYGLGLGFDF